MKLRIGRREVNISNPDKVFYPKRGLKKIDLVNYYLDVSDCVLNRVQRRPMQMLRYPDGAEEWFFYQVDALAERAPAHGLGAEDVADRRLRDGRVEVGRRPPRRVGGGRSRVVALGTTCA